MNQSRRLRIACVAAVVVLIAIGFGIGYLPGLQRRNTVDPHSPSVSSAGELTGEYIGSRVCADCHPRIAESYRQTGMGRSLSSMADASRLEDYQDRFSFSPDGLHQYFVESSENGVHHRERLIAKDGNTLFDQAAPIEFAMGSGNQGRSYLLNREGNFFLSPIGWYSRAGKWDLSPGYQLPQHQRFSREVTEGCVDCHSGRMNLDPDRVDHFLSPPLLETAIGCERCHGPGRDHVLFHQRDHASGQDPIINPQRLAPAEREDICSQCHLQGEGRYTRPGKRFGDFRPGQRLEETYLILVKGTRATSDGKTQAVSQVEQTRASACFQKSNGTFGCVSCHDPHSEPPRETRDLYYREKCLECHSDRGCNLDPVLRKQRQPNDSCIACHMPRLNASDIPHTSQTDHRILRHPAESPPSSEANDEVPRLFDGAEHRLPPALVNRVRGIWMSERAEFTADASLAEKAFRLLIAADRQTPDDVEILNALGTACATAGRLEESVHYWEQSLARSPLQASTLRSIAIQLTALGRSQPARLQFEKYLKLQPADARMWGRYSQLLGQSGDIEPAIAAAEKSVALDPSNAKVYAWLAELYGRLGKDEQRRHYRRLSEQIQSVSAP